MLRILTKHLESLLKSSRLQTGKFKAMGTNKLDVEVNRIVWIDLEMTGLNVESDKIMEVACLVTDADLNIVTEGINLVIHHPEEVLNDMHPWCVKQHGSTGLTPACLESKLTIEEADTRVYDFLLKHTAPQCSPLAGNSVYMDKMFMLKYMPKVCSHLHYRIIDTSTVKELCRRWNPEVYKNVPKKEFKHRALQDIVESVEELKFYKCNFMNATL